MLKKHWVKIALLVIVVFLLFKFTYNSLVYVRASGVPIQPIV